MKIWISNITKYKFFYFHLQLLFSLLIIVALSAGCKTNTIASRNTTINSTVSTEYKIGTYNVRYKNNNDNRNGHAWNERLDGIIGIIKKYDFDIIGVQEPFEDQLNDMSAKLKGYQRFGVSDDAQPNSTSNHHHDIFYKNDKFKLENWGSFWLAPGAPLEPPADLMTTAWGGKAKVCTWGKFKDLKTSHIFFVFNTHFYYANETTRNNSAILILDKIKEIAGGKAAIFMGDLNFTPQSSGYKILSNSSLLNDSYDMAVLNYPPDTSKHQTFNQWHTDPGLIANKKHKGRIDYIFLTEHWKNKVIRSEIIWDTYVKDSLLKMPSDHNPVMLVLEKL